MRLEHTPRPEQTVRVSARLITSSTILHLSSDELERAVNQEQIDNPALNVGEQNICLFCGTRLYGSICPTCGHFTRMEPSMPSLSDSAGAEPQWGHQQTFYDIDNVGFAQVDSDDAFDPMARLSAGKTLAETLLQQLETLIAPGDGDIAEQLVGNLNERGYLEISVADIAQILEVPVERVEYVLSQLQTLEPLGIGARDLRECLLIQLDALSELHPPHPLARTLIENYLDPLGHNHFHEIARQLKTSEHEVRESSRYIRSVLHPFPAHIFQPESTRQGSGTTYIRPDVIIREADNGYEVELIEKKRYRFDIKASYTHDGDESASPEVQRYMHHHADHARFFIDCVQRRWRTLQRVTELITDYQREFLARGVRYLRPLTRAEVATRLSLDEGTVSRATANKYALLPNGRLMPLSDFFDGSLSIKDVIRELIQSEEPGHRLSDEEIARILTARGIPMARRTVTKYREEMGIGSSRER